VDAVLGEVEGNTGAVLPRCGEGQIELVGGARPAVKGCVLVGVDGETIGGCDHIGGYCEPAAKRASLIGLHPADDQLRTGEGEATGGDRLLK
jgi:hypothetical protein